MANIQYPGRKFIRFIKFPLKALCKFRDAYVKTLTGCARKMEVSSMGGYGGYCASAIPKSFDTISTRSGSDDDLHELIRTLSQRRLSRMAPVPTQSTAARSRSVSTWTIDEDKPFEREGDYKLNETGFYPRSRSYAVRSCSTQRLF